MGKFFKVVQEKVKYPTWCPHGLILKEMDGNRKYPVDKYLGDILISKIGQEVEENIDFEVVQRVMENGSTSAGKTAMLCDEGEIAGGRIDHESGDWYLSMIGGDKEYRSKSLYPIQHAQRVVSHKYLEDIKWRKIRAEFEKKFTHIDIPKAICEWFRNKFEEV